jgi:hypothetical protein
VGLVETAAAARAGVAEAAPPKQCVLEGIIRLLLELHWSIIECSRPPVAMLALLQQAAKDGRFDFSTAQAARDGLQELARQVMTICGAPSQQPNLALRVLTAHSLSRKLIRMPCYVISSCQIDSPLIQELRRALGASSTR